MAPAPKQPDQHEARGIGVVGSGAPYAYPPYAQWPVIKASAAKPTEPTLSEIKPPRPEREHWSRGAIAILLVPVVAHGLFRIGRSLDLSSRAWLLIGLIGAVFAIALVLYLLVRLARRWPGILLLGAVFGVLAVGGLGFYAIERTDCPGRERAMPRPVPSVAEPKPAPKPVVETRQPSAPGQATPPARRGSERVPARTPAERKTAPPERPKAPPQPPVHEEEF